MEASFVGAIGLLLLSCLLIVIRPRGLPIVVPASVGGLLALACGFEPLAALPRLWGLVGDAMLTLAGLMIVSLALDRIGFFRWCAVGVARACGGRARLIWWGFMGLAWLVTAVLANDGAMLLLIPLYAEILQGAGLDRSQAMAYLFPAGYLIDVASTPLMSSNLTNLMVADAFRLSFSSFVRLMAVPTLVLGVASMALSWWVFRSALPARIGELPDPGTTRRQLVIGWGSLGILVLGFVGAPHAGVPVGAVALAVAAGLGGYATLSGQVPWRTWGRLAPWPVIVFALGLFVMVDAVGRMGASAGLVRLWTGAGSLLAIGGSLSVLAALLNNLPASLLGLLAFGRAPQLASHAAIATSVVAANVAPKLTPYGSLATLLWMSLLASRGIRVGWGEFVRLSVPMTLPLLLLGLASAAWVR